MKKFLIWTFIWLFSYFYIGGVSWFVIPNHDWYLTFEHWIVSAEEEIEIENYIYSIWKETDVEIAVVIVWSLDWEEIWEIWHQIGEEWWVWDMEKDNGIVILISILDREWTIRVWYWLEWTITDSRAMMIWEDNFPSYFREWDYAGGVLAAVEDIHLYLIHEPEIAYRLAMTKFEYFISSLTVWIWPLWILGIPNAAIYTFVWIFYFFLGFFLLNAFVVKKVGKKKEVKEHWWNHFMIIALIFSAALILLSHNILRSFIESFLILLIILAILTSDPSSWGWYSSSSWSSSSSSWGSSSGGSFGWFGWGSFGGWWASGSW